MENKIARDVESAIVAAALDYYEGWFNNEPDRMDRALHHELVKRSIADDHHSITTLSARQMINWTAEGVGQAEDRDDRQIRVHINHVHDSIATVTVTSAIYVDYLHVVKVGTEWKILNVLWARA